jgi:hypothetical protein
LDIMIHGKPRTEDRNPISLPSHHSLNRVQQILDDFDTATVALEKEKAFIGQMGHFRQFLLASLCCVVLHKSHDTDTIEMVNEIMRRRVSDTSEKNLARLRKGALWVHSRMAELAGDSEGYEGNSGHLAYEIFVLCKYRLVFVVNVDLENRGAFTITIWHLRGIRK